MTYNGADTVVDCLRSIASQLGSDDKILIIDNASSDNTAEFVRDSRINNMELIVLKENAVVAKAYNAGIEKASEKGFRWLFLLDQDSICMPNCFETLIGKGIELRSMNESVGVLFPTSRSISFNDIIYYPYLWNGTSFKPVNHTYQTGEEIIPVHSSISSGALYLVEALEKIGGFCEKYFIDFVDHECHMRLHKAGYGLYWIKKATIMHELGKAIKAKDGDIIFVHNPTRYYYMGRNMTSGYWNLGGYKALISFWHGSMLQLRRLKKVEWYPVKSFCFFIKGIIDACRRRYGPL